MTGRHACREMVHQEHGQGLPAARDPNECSCPQCGQLNLRVANNNHIACRFCQQHFCALCRTILKRRGGGLHFSSTGCKQHTATL